MGAQRCGRAPGRDRMTAGRRATRENARASGLDPHPVGYGPTRRRGESRRRHVPAHVGRDRLEPGGGHGGRPGHRLRRLREACVRLSEEHLPARGRCAGRIAPGGARSHRGGRMDRSLGHRIRRGGHRPGTRQPRARVESACSACPRAQHDEQRQQGEKTAPRSRGARHRGHRTEPEKNRRHVTSRPVGAGPPAAAHVTHRGAGTGSRRYGAHGRSPGRWAGRVRGVRRGPRRSTGRAGTRG